LPIADQEVGWRARNGRFQICHQKLHGTVERCIRCQCLTLGALEKSIGLNIQGKGQDVPKGSIWNFLSILKGCIKDIDWATKDMGTLQDAVISTYTRP
jgi:hypothetical protein